jgi:hypothetical protein
LSRPTDLSGTFPHVSSGFFRVDHLFPAYPSALGCVNLSLVNPLLDIRAIDDAHIVAIWGRTLIQIWRGNATGEASGEVNRIGRELVGSDTFPATSLFIVERGSPPPGEETRRNFAAFSRDIVSRMNLSVVVAEGGGFRGALVRAVGVTLTTVMPHRSKFEFVNDLGVAVRLLAPHLPPGVGSAEKLMSVTDELRKKIGMPLDKI